MYEYGPPIISFNSWRLVASTKCKYQVQVQCTKCKYQVQVSRTSAMHQVQTFWERKNFAISWCTMCRLFEKLYSVGGSCVRPLGNEGKRCIREKFQTELRFFPSPHIFPFSFWENSSDHFLFLRSKICRHHHHYPPNHDQLDRHNHHHCNHHQCNHHHCSHHHCNHLNPHQEQTMPARSLSWPASRANTTRCLQSV